MRIWGLERGRLKQEQVKLEEAAGLERELVRTKISRCRQQGYPYTIALTGAGGKTTAMLQLAKELSEDGWKTAVITSTHIFVPETGLVFITEKEENRAPLEDEREYMRLEQICREAEERKIYVTAGRQGPAEQKDNKLSALSASFLEQLKRWADILLVEADGSRRLPLKVPAPWEPVIPEETSLVIGCAGLSSIGRQWKDVCFRQEYAKDFFAEELVTAEAIAGILTDSRGTKKSVGDREYVILLNQADSEEERKQGERILALTEEKCARGICTCFLPLEDRG